MKILGIETSSSLFSLSLCEDETIIYEIRKDRLLHQDARDAHIYLEAQRLMGYLVDERLEAIAVSIGPGMFTSLRVGMSIAKGLSLAHHIPVVGVNTLDIIGLSVPFFSAPLHGFITEPGLIAARSVIAVINAYHGEIYAAIYSEGKRVTDYLLTTPLGLIETAMEFYQTETDVTVAVIGPGVKHLEEASQGYHGYGFRIVPVYSDIFVPSASKAVALALPRIKEKKFDDVDWLEPYYIKKTDAERNYGKR